jgi:hypothetical protein
MDMDMTNGSGGFMWLVLIFVLLFGMGGAGLGGNNAAMAGFATQADLNNAINQQTTALNQQQILLSSANNNYETAQLINGLGMANMNQNNSNLVNAIQGFNNLSAQITNQTNVLSSKLDNLGYQMGQCCCEIKTQMLQDRLTDKTADLVAAQGVINNSQQSQYLLGQMGKWVANAPATTT